MSSSTSKNIVSHNSSQTFDRETSGKANQEGTLRRTIKLERGQEDSVKDEIQRTGVNDGVVTIDSDSVNMDGRLS
jgi:hypothetical protein